MISIANGSYKRRPRTRKTTILWRFGDFFKQGFKLFNTGLLLYTVQFMYMAERKGSERFYLLFLYCDEPLFLTLSIEQN